MELETIPKTKTRIYFFDLLRGLMLISMIIYHAVYDLVILFKIDLGWFFTPATNFWQLTICGTFILVSGSCCWYSKNNFKRGSRLFLLACAFSLVTWLAVPNMIILFGLLHFLSISILLFPLLKKFLTKTPVLGGSIVCICLFILTYHVSKGWIGIQPALSFALPSWLYQTDLLFPFGFYSPRFYSSDYFPMLPYFFLFLTGAFIGKVPPPAWMEQSHCHFLEKIGKNSLWIYLFHQPILVGTLFLIVPLLPH